MISDEDIYESSSESSSESYIPSWMQYVDMHPDKSEIQLKKMYKEDYGVEPQIFIYDDTADIKINSLLEELKQDLSIFPNGINYINDKIRLKDFDDISDKEKESWKLAFEMALSDDYTLSKEQLLSTHDWWINRLYIDNDADEIDMVISKMRSDSHVDIYDFLDSVLNSFTIEQLFSIGHPDME